jgi:hypothetical protein
MMQKFFSAVELKIIHRKMQFILAVLFIVFAVATAFAPSANAGR